MRHLKICLLSTVFLASVTTAQAAPVALGLAGEFNLFSLHDVKSSGTAVQGAVAAGGNLSASNFSINAADDGYGGNAVVVGGNLSYQSGSIKNGNAYVGGTHTTASVGFNGQWTGGAAPFSFAEQASQLTQLSTSLSGLKATGHTSIQWGGMTFIGTNSGLDVFNLAGSDLAGVTYSSFSNLAAGSTVILNVSGTSAGFQGGTPAGFANYNVLFNFFEATSLSFNGVGVYGSILAPLAAVHGGSGQMNGNVIVSEWDSNIAINDNHTFNAIEVAQFVPVAATTSLANAGQAVPEPKSAALFALALTMLYLNSRRARRGRRVRLG